MEVEFNKEELFTNAKALIERLDRLDIIYLRVSTKKEGQKEGDQLKDILQTFNLKIEDVLLIQAKESAFQLWAQKNRKFNIIKDLFEEFIDEDKILYVWDIDRIYRNQDMTVDFFRYIGKKNGMVISFRQQFLHQLKGMGGGFGKAMYNFMVEMFGFFAEDESVKRGERLKKSLTEKDGRLYTNKGNLYGAKLKTVSGKKITSVKMIEKIERVVFKKVVAEVVYEDIMEFMASKNVHISKGYITNIKKKYLSK